MLNLQSFIEEALQGNGVQNDSFNVWVDVDDKQYTVPVINVLSREEEQAPYEASYTLKDDKGHGAWGKLYSQYMEDQLWKCTENFHGNTCDIAIVENETELGILGEYLVKDQGYTKTIDYLEFGFASYRHPYKINIMIDIKEEQTAV